MLLTETITSYASCWEKFLGSLCEEDVGRKHEHINGEQFNKSTQLYNKESTIFWDIFKTILNIIMCDIGFIQQ